MSVRSRWNDTSIEVIIGTLLRVGVLLAAAVVLAGGIFYLVRQGTAYPHYKVFTLESAHLRHIPDIIKEAFALHAMGIMQLGLLLLIATPIARVLFSVFAFLAERDYMYVVVTIIVFCVLMFSLIGGHSL